MERGSVWGPPWEQGRTTAQHWVALCSVKYIVHCTALHFIALHCTLLNWTDLHCTALFCFAQHFTALHCTALHCPELQKQRYGSYSISGHVWSSYNLLTFSWTLVLCLFYVLNILCQFKEKKALCCTFWWQRFTILAHSNFLKPLSDLHPTVTELRKADAMEAAASIFVFFCFVKKKLYSFN